MVVMTPMITLGKKASESWLTEKNMKVTLVCLGKNMSLMMSLGKQHS